MRLLLVTWNAPAHLFAMVPLGWAAQVAGHEVRVAAPPSCTEAIGRTGLTAVPVGTQRPAAPSGPPPGAPSGRWPVDWAVHPELLDDGRRELLRSLAARQFAAAEPMLDDLIEFARWWSPDAVVYDPTSLAGEVAATVLGVPAFACSWGRAAAVRIERGLGSEPLPGYARLFERFECQPPQGPAAWFDPFPAGLWLAEPDLPRQAVRFVPGTGGDAGLLPGWLREHSARPRICVTSAEPGGLVRPEAVRAFYRHALTVLSDVDAEVVVPAGPAARALLAEIPHTARIVDPLAAHLLVPGCRLTVHQGDGLSTLAGLGSGVPQYILAPRPEQALVGHQLHRAGAGGYRSLSEPVDVPAERAMLDALLAPESGGAAARKLQEETLALPLPAAVLSRIESATR
ncbi:glycosyltransferase [Amycolatopsis panacis]|nr:glycosyltransferase [Amycolatopsis panacis]